MGKGIMERKIKVFDTTLRDGEQSPGATMNCEEKILIAEALDNMGVDIIEAGFPAASPGDTESVKAVAGIVKNAVVCGFCRATEGDIEKAVEAVRPARRKRINILISTSSIHLKYKLKLSREELLEKTRQAVRYARNLLDDIEVIAEDATRTDPDFLARCVEAAISEGASTIGIPDTVGYSTPAEYRRLFEQIREKVPSSDQVILAAHCHDDLGLATANSLAGIEGGAEQVECTVNGIGERAGNAALEEIVMAARTRRDVLPFTFGIQTEKIINVSKLVSGITGFTVQKNKSIVGANAFAHEAGIHQDGYLKARETYEIMDPKTVGLRSASLVLGKHSGRAALKNRIQELGISVSDEDMAGIFKRFKALGDRKNQIMDEDLIALVDGEIIQKDEEVRLLSYHISGNSQMTQTAFLTLQEKEDEVIVRGESSSAANAMFNAIDHYAGFTPALEDYRVYSVTGGTDAQVEVSIILKYDGRSFRGVAYGVDVLHASCHCYLQAVMKIQRRRKESHGSSFGE